MCDMMAYATQNGHVVFRAGASLKLCDVMVGILLPENLGFYCMFDFELSCCTFKNFLL